eukprot:5024199-Prorocentrum_lima.AAC.1
MSGTLGGSCGGRDEGGGGCSEPPVSVAWWARRLLHAGSSRGPATRCGSRAASTRSRGCPHGRSGAASGALSACTRTLLCARPG